jgi:hypothetical protein
MRDSQPHSRPCRSIRGKTYRPVPNEAEVLDVNGEYIGGVIVFADDGYLSNLEVFWLWEPISPFPPLDRLRIFVNPRAV